MQTDWAERSEASVIGPSAARPFQLSSKRCGFVTHDVYIEGPTALFEPSPGALSSATAAQYNQRWLKCRVARLCHSARLALCGEQRPLLFHGHIRLLLFSQSQTSYLLTCSSITSLSGQLAQITQFPMHDKYLSPASHGLQAANLKVLFRSHGRQAAEPSNDK